MNATTIHFPAKVSVTNQEIDVSGLSEAQRAQYLGLCEEMIAAYRGTKKPRVVIGLVGPSGSGKSVTAELCKQIIGQFDQQFRFETLGIDAFHYPNTYLQAHESSGVTLKGVKGRYDTYDVAKLAAVLEDFRDGATVSLPAYSRKTHDPVENAVTIREERALLLLEGLWLLYDQNGWEQIAPYLDFAFFVEIDQERAKEFVVERHMRGGRTRQEANNYYDSVDAKNFDLVMDTKSKADKIIPPYFYQ